MRVVYIDAASRTVSQVEIEPNNGELMRLCGTLRAKPLVTLPNGDVLVGGEGDLAAPGFSIGGSPSFRSNAVLLGKRDRWRQHTAPRSGAERIAALVRWVEEKPAEAPGVRAIVIDPGQRLSRTSAFSGR